MLDKLCFRTGAVYIPRAEGVSHADLYGAAVFFLHIYRRNVGAVCNKRSGKLLKLFERPLYTVKNIIKDTGAQCCTHGSACAFHRFSGHKSRCALIDLYGGELLRYSDDLADKPFVSHIDHFLHGKAASLSDLYDRSVYRKNLVHNKITLLSDLSEPCGL